MTRDERIDVIPAAPGWRTVVLDEQRGYVVGCPVVAWRVDTCWDRNEVPQSGAWPVTVYDEGLEAALICPDGRVIAFDAEYPSLVAFNRAMTERNPC